MPLHSTVVLVEDDAALREAVAFALESQGYNVMACDSGEALLEMELPEASACLVVDFRLGGMTGADALEALRNRGVTYPSIVMTTAPSEALRKWAERTTTKLIEKPLFEDALTSAIDSLLQTPSGRRAS